jgi:ribonuclease HI
VVGSCLNSGDIEARAGGGVWFGPNHPNNMALKIPGENQSSQIGALAAVFCAIQKTPPFSPLHFISNSKYVIKGLTAHLPKWEQSGWIGIANEEFFKPIVSLLKERGAISTLKWAKSLNIEAGIEAAISLAKSGAQKEDHNAINLSINTKFNLTGA